MAGKKGGDSNKPAPPKKPLTAFFLYKGDIYDDVKKANPDKKMTDLTKIISTKWNNVDAATKSKYEKKNEEAKEKYEKEMKAYVDQYGPVEKKKRGSKKGGKKKGKKGSDDDDDSDEDDDSEDEKPAKKGKGSKKK
mmetsp:Transcript_34168/g.39839  ORF Transcript_34168/g.39839 Transcript_34168/m.39839 type:complete len:136 (+) Transcript_34168:45-452(+)